MKLARTTLALVRGSVAIAALGGCGGASVTNNAAPVPPVAQISTPVDAPVVRSDNTTTSVTQSPEDYPVDCGRG